MNKKVLIIVLTYNSSEYFRDCFSSLNQTDYPRQFFDILVVDNASTDGSIDRIKSGWPAVKIIVNEKNLGFAAGNNVGLRYAIDHGFDYVYLLNQDTAVKSDFLTQAVKLAETENRIAAVQSKLLLYQDKTKINSIGNDIHYLGFAFAGGYKLPDRVMPPKEITYPSGASVLIKVEVLKRVGLFNPEFFMYHEDVDLGWRFWLAGYKCLLAPESVVYHRYEFSRSIKKYYYLERNRYLVILQNYKLATLFLISPAWLVMDGVMFFYSFYAGWWREELKIYGYFFRLDNLKKILVTRQQIQKNRQVADKEIMKRFVGKIEFQELNNPILKYIINPIFDWYWQIIKLLIRW